MRSGFRYLLAGFFALWFGAIVPGHTRGMVRLPGVTAAAGEAGEAQGCAGGHCSLGGGDREVPERDAPGEEDPTRQCALCQLLAHKLGDGSAFPPMAAIGTPSFAVFTAPMPVAAPVMTTLPPGLTERGPPA